METAVEKEMICNGVSVTALMETIAAVKADPTLAEFRFDAGNQWQSGGHNRTAVKEFYGCGQIDQTRTAPFELDADEPPILLGEDKGPNPVEFILHGLIACMTTSMVYHAAARGITIDAVTSTLSGDLDLRGFLGLSEEVPKGYQKIRVSMTVSTEADTSTLRECISFSPVYEMISRSLPVEVDIEIRQ